MYDFDVDTSNNYVIPNVSVITDDVIPHVLISGEFSTILPHILLNTET